MLSGRLSPDRPAFRIICTVTERLALVLAFLYAATFIFVATLTLHYPFAIEWMEGQNIDVVQRIVSGLPLYVKPSIEYVPFIYTPYYYYVVAFVSLFTGVDFFPARLISLLATLGTGIVLYRWIRREGGSRAISFIAAGLFFATYKLSGRWFDNSRVDSLFLMLTLLSLYLFYYYRQWQHSLLVGALLATAFFTKQSALVIAFPAIAAMLLIDWRHALLTAAITAILTAGGIMLYDHASDGWFSFYAFTVPAGHSVDKSAIAGYWTRDLFRHFYPLILPFLFTAFMLLRQDIKKALWFGALAAGFIGASYLSRLHGYGYINVLMPAHALLALLGGLSLAYARSLGLSRWKLVVPFFILLQLVHLHYNPMKFIPSKESADTGKKFLEEIFAIDGEIFMPEIQFVQTRIGKKSYDYGMAAFDLFRADLKDKDYLKDDLRKELRVAIHRRQFAALVPGRFVRQPDLTKFSDYYAFERQLDYPEEYVSGAIKAFQVDLYTVTPEKEGNGE